MYGRKSKSKEEGVTPFFTEGIHYGKGGINNNWVTPLQHVPAGKGLILDLGCGGGETRNVLETKGYTWVGLDIQKMKGVLVVGDAHQLPMKDEAVTAVYSCQVFEHLVQPWRAAGEVFRVLKPGGIFYGSMSCLEPFHHSYFNYTHWGVEALLRHAGLVPRRIEAGSSAFLILLHHLVDGAGPELSTPLAKLTVKPFVWFLRFFGKMFIMLRYGRTSSQMRKIDGYFAKFALRFAGHIQFVAEKPEPLSETGDF